MFLECIDPASPFLAHNFHGEYFDLIEAGDNDAEGDGEAASQPILNESNVRSIAPLFHELQMDEYLKKCDAVLYKSSKTSNWDGTEEYKVKRLELLAFSAKYGLDQTRKHFQRQFETKIERLCWGCGDAGEVDIRTIETLVDICRPLSPTKLQHEDAEKPPPKKQRRNDSVYESQTYKDLWAQMSSCFDQQMSELMSDLPLDEVNNGKAFSRIVYHALHRYHKQMKAKLKQKVQKMIGNDGQCKVKIVNESIYTHNAEVSINQLSNTSVVDMGSIKKAVKIAVARLVPFDAGSGNFTRTFEISDDAKVLSIVFVPILSRDNDFSKFSKPTKVDSKPKPYTQLRFSEPDLTVVVGSGDQAKEFECHDVLLSLVSKSVASKIRTSNKRLLLSDFDPNNWQHFYQCIDPRHNGSTLSEENVEALVPFFAHFNMNNYLVAAFDTIEFLQFNWEYDGPPSVESIVCLLKCAAKHGLTEIQFKAELLMNFVFENDEDGELLLYDTREYDLQTTRDLISLCLPIQRNTNKDPFTSTDCSVLWSGIHSYITDKLKSVTFDRVEKSECEMFSNFVHHLLLHEAEDRRRHGDW